MKGKYGYGDSQWGPWAEYIGGGRNIWWMWDGRSGGWVKEYNKCKYLLYIYIYIYINQKLKKKKVKYSILYKIKTFTHYC